MRFLLAVHRSATAGPVPDDPALRAAIDQVNAAMVEAGIRVFVGGLRPDAQAWALRRQADGRLAETQGRFLPGDDYLDGFWVIEVPDLAEALAWGRRAAEACRSDLEVRPFH